MSEMMIARTPELIANEINGLKHQARMMVLYHSVEIGRRLVEAKNLLNHGEWGNWLETSVDYSQRTATNLMRIAEEYGSEPLLGDGLKSQAFANLSVTQAVALLGVPAEEREDFLESHDLEAMSTRELQAAIKERDEAKERADTLELAQSAARQRAESAEKMAADRLAIIDQLTKAKTDATKAQTKLEEDLRKAQAKASNVVDAEVKSLQNQLATAQRQVKELSTALEEATKPPADIEATVAEVVPESVQRELDQIRERNRSLENQLAQANESGLRFKVHFGALKDAFRLLEEDLGSMAGDAEQHGKYRKAMSDLIGMMQARLEGVQG